MFKAEVLRKLETVPEDMPLFLLLGSDPNIPSTIEHWVGESKRDGVNEPKLREALDVAAMAEGYAPKKLPD